MPKTPAALAASAMLLAVSLTACTNFPDPVNRAAADGVIGAGAGALFGGVLAGPAAIPIGIVAGAAAGATAGALTPPLPYQLGPTFPW